MFREFSVEFKRRYNEDSAWINVNDAVNTIKAFAVQLVEIVTAQWTMYVPTARKCLYSTDEYSATKLLENTGNAELYLLYQPLLNGVLFYVYSDLIDVYYMQTQNRQVDSQLKKLQMMTLSDLDVPVLLQLPYQTSIQTLSKISKFSAPDDMLEILKQSYFDILADLNDDNNEQQNLFDVHCCSIIMYILLKANVDKLSCMCNMIEDFVVLESEDSQILNLYLSAMQWSLEFDPDVWEQYINDREESKHDSFSQTDEKHLSSVNTQTEDKLVDETIDSIEDDDYLGDLDMDSIQVDLQDKLSSILLGPPTTTNKTDLEKLEQLVKEKEEQIAQLTNEKQQLQDKLTEELNSLRTQMSQMEKMYEKEQGYRRELQERLENLISEKQKQVEDLTKERDDALTQLAIEREQVTKHLKTIEDLQSQEVSTLPEQQTETEEQKKVEEEIYVGLYDFNGVDETELSFKQGDHLIVIERHDDGWWKACLLANRELTGFVPSTYLTENQ